MGRVVPVSNGFDTTTETFSNTISIALVVLEQFRAEIYKYYEECDWSKKWAEGLQKILTWKVFTDWT